MAKLNLALAVHGRFHMFDLAREMRAQGHNVTLFTNYPPFIVKRFGIVQPGVKTDYVHGIMTRVFNLPVLSRMSGNLEGYFHRKFGRWLRRAAMAAEPQGGWDAILCMSGIALEAFQHYRNTKTLCILHRGSTHIRDQWDILNDEELRTGHKVEKPSRWIIQREESEYEACDLIRVQSPFAFSGFLKKGVPDSKIDLIPLGVSRAKFSATDEQVAERTRRITAGEPLRILWTGTFCLRKGAWDLRTLVNQLDPERFSFRFVGTIAEDGQELANELKDRVTFIPKVPQDELPAQYAWGDIFMLPSLEDGFAVVVTQALSCGLPAMVSKNTGSSLFIKDDVNGWVVPIRAPEVMRDILNDLDQNRAKLVGIIKSMNTLSPPGSWEDTAAMTIEDITNRCAIKSSMHAMS